MSHFYTPTGTLVDPWTPGALVSPTTFLHIVKNPGLDDWRKRVGDEAADLTQLDSSEKGTRIHKACEELLNGLDACVAEDEVPYVLGFVNWYAKVSPEIIEAELFVVSNKYEYAGTVDLICRIDGELWIIDIKTGADRPKEHALQLRAYEQAYFETTGEHARMGILGLTHKNKQGYRRVKEYSVELFHVLVHKWVFDYWRSELYPRPKAQWGGGIIKAYVSECPVCQHAFSSADEEKAHGYRHMVERRAQSKEGGLMC